MPRRFEDAVPTGFGDIGRFVDGDERRDLAGEPLSLAGVMDDPFGKFGARWIVSAAILATGEKIAIGLAKNSNRDRQLATLRELLDGGETLDPVVLESRTPAHGGNKFWTFRSATDDELAGTAELPTDDEGPATSDDAEPDDEASTGGEPTAMPGERLRRSRRSG